MVDQFQFSEAFPTYHLAVTALPSKTVPSDPAIDQGAQHVIFLGLALLAIVIVAIVGILSARVEHAIIAAVVLSLCLIIAFLSL